MGRSKADKTDKTCKDCKQFYIYFKRQYHRCGSSIMCELCGSSFKRNYDKDRHESGKRCTPQDVNVNPSTWMSTFVTCQGCQRRYIPHYKGKHRCNATEYCTHCGRDFSSKTQFDKHVSKKGACLKFANQSYKMDSGQTAEEYLEGLDEDVKKGKTCKLCDESFPYFKSTGHICKSTQMCHLCGSSFTCRTTRTTHLREKRCTPYFACRKCGMKFTTDKDRASHLLVCQATVPKAVSAFKKFVTCQLCKHRYIPDHRAKHRCKRTFVCSNCGRDFIQKCDYNKHVSKKDACTKFVESQMVRKRKERKADKKKGSKTTCPICRKTFVNFKPKIHKCYAKNMCKKCGNAFGKPYLLKRHKLNQSCSSRNPCKYCGIVFSSFLHVISHQLVCRSKPPIEVLTCKLCNHKYHNDVNHECSFKITCGECGRKFSSHLKRVRHVMLGSCTATKSCFGCGKKYKSALAFRSHLRVCYLWKYLCGEKLPEWKSKLGVTEDKINKCPVCWKSFTDLETLDRHLKEAQCQNTDRDDQEQLKNKLQFYQKFFCCLCKQVYASKSQLDCHITLQSCLAIPKCDNCGNCFKDGGFEEHVLMDLCNSEKGILKQQGKPPKPPQISESTPAGYCSFCFKLLLKGEATDHLKTCPELPLDKIPTCPFGSCEFSSPLNVFLHTANLKVTSCSKWGYPCGKCAFITIDKESAVNHAKSKHNLDITFSDGKIESGFACFVCNKKFYDDEDSARFHTSDCSQTFGLGVRVYLKRCSEKTVEREVPAKQVIFKNDQPEAEKEYVPSLVLVTTENYMKL